MYLSKVMVSGAACRNPYEIHRALWGLFPGDKAAKRDFLFRVVQAECSRAEILMQSLRRPEESVREAKLLASKAYHLSLRKDQRLRFYLVANPAKKINDEGGRENAHGEQKKCRVPLVHEDDQRVWISRKLKDAADLETMIIEPRYPIRFLKNKEDRAGKIQPVCFHGILIVKDADRFSDSVIHGVGPGKAFGCGLMSIAKV